MTPIQDLLHRIQWDTEFAKGEFMLGYYDRVEDRIVRVPFRRVHFEKGEHFSFHAVEGDGSVHMVPLHRVREVWHDDSLIWHREGTAWAGSRGR